MKLTDEQIEALLDETFWASDRGKIKNAYLYFARAIESAVREQVIEEAVQMCEKTRAVSAVSYELRTLCAGYIRALKDQS